MPNNPYQYGNPVEPENFVGRGPFVNQMANLLVYPGGRSIALVAGRRCGKTSFLFALADQLRRPEFTDTSAYHPFPIYYDMKGRPSDCKDDQEFLRHLLVDVIHRHVSPGGLGGRPERAWKKKIELDNPEYIALKEADSINLYQFEGAVRYILETLEEETPTDAPVRLVLLFDEVDSLLDEPWSDGLFNKLRTLVSSGEVRKQARVVLSGSTQFLAKTSERGSPLWNILDTHYLEPFDEDSFHTLSARFEDIPEDVETAVLELGGGHPFLEQYLLYYLWEDHDGALTAAATEDIVSRFFLSKDGDLHLNAWADAVDTVGLLVFMYLANKGDWVDTKVLYKELENETPADVDEACMALNFHCFVEKDKSWRHYRARCGLLQRWLEQNFKAILAENEAENIPEVLSETLKRVSGYGDVTVIFGDQINQSGDFRNAIINLKSTLDKSKQSIAGTAHGSPDLRQEIEAQIEVIMGLLEQVPEDHDETAESLAGHIKQMIDFATETKPDKELVQTLSGRVARESAALNDALPQLAEAIEKLNELVLRLFA